MISSAQSSKSSRINQNEINQQVKEENLGLANYDPKLSRIVEQGESGEQSADSIEKNPV